MLGIFLTWRKFFMSLELKDQSAFGFTGFAKTEQQHLHRGNQMSLDIRNCG